MKITADLIVAFGLVAALILNIVLGGEAQITMNISTGLVGWLGKVMYTNAKGITQTPAQEEKKEETNDPRI